MIKAIKAGVASTEKRKIDTEIQNTVSNIIDQIDAEGDDALRRLSAKFDKWDRPNYRLSESEIAQIVDSVPESVKDDIKFAQKQIRTFAEAQRSALRDIEVETLPGVHLGHKNIPVNSVGAYVPGGRYPMVASAHMSIVTAKVAGVPRVAAATPPMNYSDHQSRRYAGGTGQRLCGRCQTAAFWPGGDRSVSGSDGDVNYCG